MESNFVRADNNNLPKIDAFKVALFLKTNADYYAVELKNVKTAVDVLYHVGIIYLQTFMYGHLKSL